MTKYLLCLFLLGCAATQQPASSPDVARIYLAESVIKYIPVQSPEEARMVIENDVRFLKRLFTQSRDPYYGRPKWSESCLADNRIGELVIEEGGFLQAASEIFIDYNANPGVCKGFKVIKRLVYCPGDKSVLHLRTPVAHNKPLTGKDLCAVR